MQGFSAEDVPLVLDATFAIAIQAYVLVLKDNVDEDFKIHDVLMQRFLNQGFDPVRSEKVSGMICDTITSLVKDAQRELK